MADRAHRASTSPPVAGLTALIVARRNASSPVRPLIDRLASGGVSVSLVETLDDLAAIVARVDPATPPCVLLDGSSMDSNDDEDRGELLAWISDVREIGSGLDPIVILHGAPPEMLVTCIHAGAGDIIDLSLEGTQPAREVVSRIAARQAARAEQALLVESLRDMVEEFLRDLIRTERRSIDLEERLTQRTRRATGELVAAIDGDPDRPPTVILVEDDRDVADRLAEELEAVGLTTFAYLSGEDAVREARRLVAKQTWFDLALVDMRLPGIDGLETIRQLRLARPGLSAFLMTGYNDPSAAANAADLGVVGFVYKPFDDLALLVKRVRALAQESQQRGREHRYLRQIKERHERVLSRYRSLSTTPGGGPLPPSEPQP